MVAKIHNVGMLVSGPVMHASDAQKDTLKTRLVPPFAEYAFLDDMDGRRRKILYI